MTIGEVFTITGWEDWLIRFAAVSVALGVIWRMWLRPIQKRILRALDEHHEVVCLLRTEFNTNGGSTIKDAIISLIECQKSMIEWMRWHDRVYASGHADGSPIGGGVDEPSPPLPVFHEVKH